jgi:glycosyltransferase involved in cell wall biosynthesis
MPAFYCIERYAFRSADRINIVSEGFADNIDRLAPQLKPRVFTNGIDDLFLNTDFETSASTGGLPLIMYAGNFGEGQGLHRVVPSVARLLTGKARFRLIGDGGRRKALEQALAEANLANVELMPPMPRDELLAQYRQADILFLHLNDLDAFKKVLPSKIFEYGATGKPVLAGVAGYAAKFMKNELPTAEVFPPLDAEAMADAALRLISGPARYDHSSFRGAFARSAIMSAMAEDMLVLHSTTFSS